MSNYEGWHDVHGRPECAGMDEIQERILAIILRTTRVFIKAKSYYGISPEIDDVIKSIHTAKQGAMLTLASIDIMYDNLRELVSWADTLETSQNTAINTLRRVKRLAKEEK